MKKLNLIATTTFGLEATVKREIKNLGYDITSSLDGRIDFCGDLSAIAKANLWLRSSDRILLKMGEFPAATFNELFDGTKALPWDDWISEDGKFIISGKSVKSKLTSVPACQSVVEKAVIEKLKKKYKTERFKKTGAEYKIQIALLNDKATLTIDTSGVGLHKRGYRPDAVVAPIKETLAAAMLELSFWRKDRVLLDPFCGSGTIAIEAALMARNIAPGLMRSFVSETWEQMDRQIWKDARKEAYSLIDNSHTPEIYASDIDPKAIELSKTNAKRAGVEDCIKFEEKDVRDMVLPGKYGVLITNPPYGERIGEVEKIRELYKEMSRIFENEKTWSLYVITSDEEFEKTFGRRADAKRKLFNGMIKTDYYQYYGEKPHKA